MKMDAVSQAATEQPVEFGGEATMGKPYFETPHQETTRLLTEIVGLLKQLVVLNQNPTKALWWVDPNAGGNGGPYGPYGPIGPAFGVVPCQICGQLGCAEVHNIVVGTSVNPAKAT